MKITHPRKALAFRRRSEAASWRGLEILEMKKYYNLRDRETGKSVLVHGEALFIDFNMDSQETEVCVEVPEKATWK